MQLAQAIRAAMVLRLCAALVVVATALVSPPAGTIGIAVCVAALACLPLRLSGPWGPFAGMNGAEHLLSATVLALAPTYLLGTGPALAAALGFVAFRALSEYASAGLTKLGDFRGWVSGRNLVLVFSSGAYGFRHLARVLRRWPTLAGMASVGVIGIEVAVPISILLPAPWTEHALALAFLFHLATGVFMGLNTFALAFAATFPAVLWLRDAMQVWIG